MHDAIGPESPMDSLVAACGLFVIVMVLYLLMPGVPL
jgi:hypothetical protein